MNFPLEAIDWQHIVFDESRSFEERAALVFEFQRKRNPVYGRFCTRLQEMGVVSMGVPLLPIQAFREADIVTGLESERSADLVFKSSGTTGMAQSRHFVSQPAMYRTSIFEGIRRFYELDDFVIWAYTPGYSSNPNSSLIWMLNELVSKVNPTYSRFLELEQPLPKDELLRITNAGKRLMLFGAAFGLMDMAEQFPVVLPEGSVILETGGMKTHRRVMSRAHMHQSLAASFGIPETSVRSEYGMAELLSQAYSKVDGLFYCPPWMQVKMMREDDPFTEAPIGETGRIGIVDLANVFSCSFLYTGDLGCMHSSGGFEVLGRAKTEGLRGCNFLLERD